MKRFTSVSFIIFLFSGVEARNTLPRSHHAIPRSTGSRRRNSDQPPWNPSTLIDPDGFLKGLFGRKNGDWEEEVQLRTSFTTDLPCQIRQVPGDGNCLFHSLSLCLQYSVNGTHWDMSNRLDDLYRHSQTLRAQAVACLRQKNRRLFLQGRETLRAHDLVTAAAQQYDLTPEQYCAAMEEDCVWGGGPEIVALSNILQRPIHVYELAVDHADDTTPQQQQQPSQQLQSASSHHYPYPQAAFVLRRMACFGSPRFDRKPPLHILSADSRFPDLQPGQQLAAGNHFLAVFPEIRKRRKRLRGGAHGDDGEYVDDNELDDDDEPLLYSRLLRWWRRVLHRLTT